MWSKCLRPCVLWLGAVLEDVNVLKFPAFKSLLLISPCLPVYSVYWGPIQTLLKPVGVGGFWSGSCTAGWVSFPPGVLWWHWLLCCFLLLLDSGVLAWAGLLAECWLSASVQGLPLPSPAPLRARMEFWYSYRDTVVSWINVLRLKAFLVSVGLVVAVWVTKDVMREPNKLVSQPVENKREFQS